MNTLTVGKHTTTVSLQDSGGNASKYTNTFAVTTSFADLATVIDQLANNARSTTISARDDGRRDPACGWPTPWGLPPRPDDRHRLGRQPGDGDDRQGAQPAGRRT